MRSRPRLRPLVVLAGVIAAALALGGCGEKEMSAQELTTVISEQVARDKTAHVESQVSDYVTMSGDVSYDPQGSQARVTLKQGAEIRIVGDKAYMSFPPLTPTGKFFEVTPDDPTFGRLLSGTGALASNSPVKDALDRGIKEVEYRGETDVDGTSLDRYSLVFDPASQAGEDSQEPVSYDVYLDEDDVLRRTVVTRGPFTITSDFTLWGESIDVTAPEPGDLIPAPSLRDPGAPNPLAPPPPVESE